MYREVIFDNVWLNSFELAKGVLSLGNGSSVSGLAIYTDYFSGSI
jgi:hypothetical protein